MKIAYLELKFHLSGIDVFSSCGDIEIYSTLMGNAPVYGRYITENLINKYHHGPIENLSDAAKSSEYDIRSLWLKAAIIANICIDGYKFINCAEGKFNTSYHFMRVTE